MKCTFSRVKRDPWGPKKNGEPPTLFGPSWLQQSASAWLVKHFLIYIYFAFCVWVRRQKYGPGYNFPRDCAMLCGYQLRY